MISGSVTSAITRSRPPQCGHAVISIPNTRRSRSAHVRGAFGGRTRSLCSSSLFDVEAFIERHG